MVLKYDAALRNYHFNYHFYSVYHKFFNLLSCLKGHLRACRRGVEGGGGGAPRHLLPRSTPLGKDPYTDHFFLFRSPRFIWSLVGRSLGTVLTPHWLTLMSFLDSFENRQETICRYIASFISHNSL